MKSKRPAHQAKTASPPNTNSFPLLFQNHPIPMWIYDLEKLAFLEVNDAAVGKYGYARDEFMALTLKDIYPPEDVRRLLADVKQKDPPVQQSGVWRHRLKDGRVIDVQITAHTLEFEGQKAALVMAYDITERQCVEAALRESQQLLQKTFDSLRDAVFIIDAKTVQIKDCNPAAAEIFGYSRQKILGKTTAFLHVDEASVEEFRRHLYSAVEEQGFLFLPEFRMKRKDGTVFPTEHSVIPLEDEQGERIGWVSVVHDITKRKQAEEALQAEHDFALQVMNAMGQGLTVTDAEGCFKYVNRAYAHMIGYAPEDLVDKNPRDVTVPEDYAVLAHESALRQAGESSMYETRLMHLNGHSVPVLITAVPRWCESGTQGAIAVISNLTDRKRLEEAKRGERKLAEAMCDTAAALNSTLDFDQVLERILTNVSRVVPHDTATIMLLDAYTDIARIVRCRGYAERGAEEAVLSMRFPIADLPGLRKMMETGQPMIIPDTRADPDWRVFAESQWIQSYLGTPICIKEKAIGFINLDSTVPGFFTQVHAKRLQAFADQAAIALENVRLLAETQLRANEFAALYETTRDLAAIQPDLPALLQTIVERAVKLLNGSGGGMYIYDAARGDLEVTVTTHPSTPVGTRLQLGEGMAGRVAQTRQPLIVDDYRTWPHRLPKYKGTPLTAVIEVPMLFGGELIGVLVVEEIGEATHKFTEVDARLLSLFAGQAAATVHNTRLFQEVHRELAERKQAEEQLKYLGTHDALTGLYNRAYFEEELARLQRGREFPVSIVMADVDGLKAINDTQGHAAGDELLRQAAWVLQAAFRAEDMVARIGGDEFAVLLPAADAAAAEQALSRIRKCQTAQNAAHKGAALRLSLGAATAEKGEMLAEALRQADTCMYQEKHQNTNRGT